MADTPADRRYTKEHEWARPEDGRVVVGITDFAQDQLGDVVFVGLPEPGTAVTAGRPMGEVESTKSVADLYSPVTGTVAAKNDAVELNPELVNADPYGAGWLVAIEGAGELDGLLDADGYTAFVAAQGE
ncbi:MAG: glycine cleavage system protein GcvH [Actinomycetota bacterium]